MPLEHRYTWICIAGLIALATTDNLFTTVDTRGQSDISFDISPQGEQIVFNAAGRGRRDLYLFKLTDRAVRRVTNSIEWESAPSFAPDGQHVIYAATRDVRKGGSIFSCGVDGSHVVRLTNPCSCFDDNPSFSPDGTHFVFARAHRYRRYAMGGWVWTDWDLYLADEDGTSIRRLTRGQYNAVSPPRFMADGRTIVFSIDLGDQGTDIYTLDTLGDHLPRPLTFDHHSSQPFPSRDGRMIVLVSDRLRHFDYEIWAIGSDGGDSREITHTQKYKICPIVTPDSHRILFLSFPKVRDNKDVRYDLWQIDSDGQDLQMLADSSLFDRPTRWRS